MLDDENPHQGGPPGPIRAITRSIAVLQAVNRGRALTVAEIADAARLPYPTAYRIIHALIHEGLIEREPERKLYRPTALVQSLAHGYQDHSNLTRISRSFLVSFTVRTNWPTMLATPVGPNMIFRDGTHTLTTMTLGRYYPGYVFPMLDSAAGRVSLAFQSDAKRAQTLDLIEAGHEYKDRFVLDGFRSGVLVQDIRKKGFASRARNHFTTPPGKNSSISAPIFHRGELVATFGVVLIASAMRMEEAEARYGPDLVATAQEITERLASTESPLSDHLPAISAEEAEDDF